MDLEREQLIEIATSVGAVGVMIGVMMAIGATYTTDGGLSAAGGQMLVGAIVFFILMMAGVGYVLATKVSGAEESDNDAANSV